MKQHHFIDWIERSALRGAIFDGNLTKDQAKEFAIKIKEWLATHWTERENPAHEVMEAVCHI